MRWNILAVFTALVLLGAGPASAEEHTGLHVGASGSWSLLDESDRVDSVADIDDDDDFGYELFLGWRFHENFAVEGGYADLGEFGGNGRESTPVAFDVAAEGAVLRAVGFFPVLDWLELTGSVGAFFYQSKVRATLGDERETTSENGTALTASAGLQVRATEFAAFRLQYQRFFDIEDNDIDAIVFSIMFQDWGPAS